MFAQVSLPQTEKNRQPFLPNLGFTSENDAPREGKIGLVVARRCPRPGQLDACTGASWSTRSIFWGVAPTTSAWCASDTIRSGSLVT